jgi:hypothetical protein
MAGFEMRLNLLKGQKKRKKDRKRREIKVVFFPQILSH